MFVDPDGYFPWLVLAIISGILIVGGSTLGGVSAYQSGRDVGTGILEGAVAGAMIAGSMWLVVGSFYVPNGLSSNLGLMMFTYGANTFLSMIQVGATQIRFSNSQGDNWSTNLMRSLCANIPKVYIGNAIPKTLPVATQFTWHIGEKYQYTIPGEYGVYYDYITTKEAWGMFRNYLRQPSRWYQKIIAVISVGSSLISTYDAIFGTPKYDNWIVY